MGYPQTFSQSIFQLKNFFRLSDPNIRDFNDTELNLTLLERFYVPYMFPTNFGTKIKLIFNGKLSEK